MDFQFHKNIYAKGGKSFLENVSQQGIADDYSGIRVSKRDQTFLIMEV
ncbi:hypothetical protein [Pectobacterium betavasculorum]|nr:hypothetical protein [Pectobacterium betavasculorum]